MGEVTRTRSTKIKLDDDDVARIATEIVGRICKRPWLIAEIEKLASATGQTKGPDDGDGTDRFDALSEQIEELSRDIAQVKRLITGCTCFKQENWGGSYG